MFTWIPDIETKELMSDTNWTTAHWPLKSFIKQLHPTMVEKETKGALIGQVLQTLLKIYIFQIFNYFI